MIRELLQHIEGIEIYPVVSLLLFVSVFLYMTFKVIRMDSEHIDRMSRMPLKSENESQEGAKQNV